MGGPLLQFPLVSGLQEGHDPKSLPPGAVTTLVNCAWTKDGRLDKRLGTKLLAGAGAPTAAKRLITRADELVVTDGVNLYSWSPTTSTWTNVGAVPEVGLTWRALTATVTGAQTSDMCRLDDGRIVHVWTAGDPTTPTVVSTHIEIFDPATGARVTPPGIGTGTSAGLRARVITDGTHYLVIWVNGTTVQCSFDDGPPQALSTGANAVTNAVFDAVYTGDAHFDIAYEQAGGGIRLRRFTFANPPVLTTSRALDGEGGNTFAAISIDGQASDGNLYVAYAKQALSGPAKLAVHTVVALTQTLVPTTIDGTPNALFQYVSVLRIDDSHCAYTFSANGLVGVGSVDMETVSYVVSSGGVLGVKRQSFGVQLLTRPFFLGGNIYMFLADVLAATSIAYGSPGAPPFPGLNAYLVEFDRNVPIGTGTWPHRYIGMTDLLTSGMWTQGFISTVVVESATKAIAALPAQADFPGTSVNWTQGTKLVDVTLGVDAPEDLWSSVDLAGEAYVAGAVLTAYDGRRSFPYGFSRSFINQTSTNVGVGGSGALAAGNYIYVVVPSYRSMAGVQHRGPGSPPWTFTAALNGKISPAVVSQSLDYKGTSLGTDANETPNSDPLRVEHILYRSIVGGSNPQKRSLDPSAAVLLNDVTVGHSVFADTVADTDASLVLAAKPVVYNESELDDFQPPAFVSLHLHRRRLFGIGGDRRTLWYSKDHNENVGVAPGFHPSAVMVFDEDIVGLATLDDKLIVFSASSIWYVQGDGPAVNGDGGYEVPNKIQVDVGCAAARSIVSMPDGVMFLSQRGLYLLGRNLQLAWIGHPVRDSLAAFPVVTSGVTVHALNQVRFTCNTADGSHGIVLTYDHVRKQWSRFEYTDTAGAVAQTPIADATLLGDVWVFATPGGAVFAEDAATYLDGGTAWVTEDVELAWIDAAGPLGYQRVRKAQLLGDRYTDCDVTLRVAVDHRATYDQTHVWRSDVLATVDGVNVGVTLKTQKSRAMRLRFTDAAPTGPGAVVGTGQGVNLSAIGLEITPLQGTDRRPAKAAA